MNYDRDIPKIKKEMADLGEAMVENCPDNDCIIYRNAYNIVCRQQMDYFHIIARCPDLSDHTLSALESSIRKNLCFLSELFYGNYAVEKYKKELFITKKEKESGDAGKMESS